MHIKQCRVPKERKERVENIKSEIMFLFDLIFHSKRVEGGCDILPLDGETLTENTEVTSDLGWKKEKA